MKMTEILRCRAGVVLLLILWTGALWSPAEAATVGSSAPERVDLVEHHSEALCNWFKAGKRNLTVVNVDAHHDFFSPGRIFAHDLPKIRQALSEQTCVEILPLIDSYVDRGDLYNIGDFLQVAFKLGVIRELWWVVPSRNRLPMDEFAEFKVWFQEYWALPAEFVAGLSYDGKIMRGNFKGLPVNMVILEDLPQLPEEVLLTIDVDYFYELNKQLEQPSILRLMDWFFATLTSKGIKSPLVEVSTSVPHSYTPLRLKYMAQRVGEWLQKPQEPSAAHYLLQEAFEQALQSRQYFVANDRAHELGKLVPQSPRPYYNFAQLHILKGDLASAERALDAAVARDPSYVLGYLSLARTLYDLGQEEQSFALLVSGQKKHPRHIQLLEMVASYRLERRQLAAAEQSYRELLAVDPGYLLGIRGLAETLLRLGRLEEAQERFADFLVSLPPGIIKKKSQQDWQSLLAEQGLAHEAVK